MKLFIDKQISPVASEVTALVSIVRPILSGILFSLKADVVAEVGGHDKVKLKMLPRLFRPGDGDVGVAFEWAVHDAIKRQDPLVMERMNDAGKLCKLPGSDFTSLMFGLEKSGRTNLIDSVESILNEDSRLLTGAQAQPIKLKKYLNMLSAAFNRASARRALPSSINGLWKADLFFGTTDKNRWLGTTLKINPSNLEGARGLRIGIVPASQGTSDKIRKDEGKNLIICPLPYDGSFMELFYTGWRIVQQFIAADAKLPKEVALPNPPERQVARELEMRREYNVVEIIEALEVQSQRDLLLNEPEVREVKSIVQKVGDVVANESIIAPVPRIIT